MVDSEEFWNKVEVEVVDEDEDEKVGCGVEQSSQERQQPFWMSLGSKEHFSF